MKINGREINLKFFLWDYCFNGLIVLDMFLITIALIFQLPQDTVTGIQYFDLIVCLILLVEYAFYTRSFKYSGINCFYTI